MGGPDFRGQPDIQTDAHVVIGTPTTALARLHVVPTGNNPPAAVFEGSGDGSGYQARIELVDKQGGRRTWMVVAGAWSGGNFGIYDDFAAKYRLFIDTSGNVGIGVDTPGEKLEVNGKIKGAAVVISQAPGADASLQRDVADSYLAISGGKTRRGPTSGGLIQLMGNARAQNPGSIQYILGEGAASPKHIFYDNGPDATVQEIASIDNSGNLRAKGNIGSLDTGRVAIDAQGYCLYG